MKPILSTVFLCLILFFYSCEKTENLDFYYKKERNGKINF